MSVSADDESCREVKLDTLRTPSHARHLVGNCGPGRQGRRGRRRPGHGAPQPPHRQ